MTPREAEIIAASTLLEAIRPQANMAAGGADAVDQPIRDAWAAALSRFRKACAEYLKGV